MHTISVQGAKLSNNKNDSYTLIIDDCDKKKCNFKRWKPLTLRILLGTLKLSLAIFFLLFVVFPLIYKFSYKLQQYAVFLNFVQWPKNPDFKNPLLYGLPGAFNFYLTTDDNVKLGVWQILPENLIESSNKTDRNYLDSVLNDGQHIILYNHGNAGHRVAPHRVELYVVLRKHFHVIAFDYRSYGDSSDIDPSEEGLVSDSMYIYKWIANRTNSKIFVWGHSLGTGVSTHSLSLLKSEDYVPAGLILESPFNNLKDEISEYPMTQLFKNLPWFSFTVVEPMQDNNLRFENDIHILNVDCPVLILHAEDDCVVPYKLGRKLYEIALLHRSDDQGPIIFHTFERKYQYGHKYICRAPEIHNILIHFISISFSAEKNDRARKTL